MKNKALFEDEQSIICSFIKNLLNLEDGMEVSFLHPFMAAGRDTFDFLSEPWNHDSAYKFATFTNSIPTQVGNWHQSGKLLWNIYRKWLYDFIPAPNTLTEKEILELEKARKFTEINFEVYFLFKEKYDNAHLDLLFLEMMPEGERPHDYHILLERAKTRVTDAEIAWGIQGKREEFQENYQLMTELGRRNMGNSKSELIEFFGEPQLSSAGEYYPTSVTPADFLQEYYPWESYTIYQEKLAKFYATTDRSFSGNLKLDPTNIEIKFEMIRVFLSRNWFLPDGMTNRAWKWTSSNAKNPGGDFPLSDGNYPPKGNLIMYPIELLLTRNISITPDLSKGNNQKVYSHFAEGALADSDWKIAGNSIVSNSINFTAFLCRLLPMSPNPNWSLWTQSKAEQQNKFITF